MRALVVIEQPTVCLADVVAVTAAHSGLAPDQITLATNSGALAADSLGGGYDLVLSVTRRAGHHTVQLLGALAAALKPGGLLVVKAEAQAGFQVGGWVGAPGSGGRGGCSQRRSTYSGASSLVLLPCGGVEGSSH